MIKTNVTAYNIIVMDQYCPAIVKVPTNISSVNISDLFDNDTSIVAKRVYTITVSAIADQGIGYPSSPVIVSKFLCVYVYVLLTCTYGMI